jgi:hypothetical protein
MEQKYNLEAQKCQYEREFQESYCEELAYAKKVRKRSWELMNRLQQQASENRKLLHQLSHEHTIFRSAFILAHNVQP